MAHFKTFLDIKEINKAISSIKTNALVRQDYEEAVHQERLLFYRLAEHMAKHPTDPARSYKAEKVLQVREINFPRF